MLFPFLNCVYLGLSFLHIVLARNLFHWTFQRKSIWILFPWYLIFFLLLCLCMLKQTTKKNNYLPKKYYLPKYLMSRHITVCCSLENLTFLNLQFCSQYKVFPYWSTYNIFLTIYKCILDFLFDSEFLFSIKVEWFKVSLCFNISV